MNTAFPGRLFSALPLLLCLQSAAAADWLEQGKSLLRGLTGNSAVQELAESEIEAGLREALRVGTRRVVDQVGAVDGFNNDPAIHIPLPGELDKVRSALNAVGMGAMLDDLELRLNRAAETAAPRARKLFVAAIAGMTLDDVRNIHDGPDDAATRYFQGKMSAPLADEMRPVIDQSLADVGAVKAYDDMMGRYQALPFVPDVKAELTDHVVDGGIEGIFHYLAVEEAKIRTDPAARTTELLKKVFSRDAGG